MMASASIVSDQLGSQKLWKDNMDRLALDDHMSIAFPSMIEIDSS